MYCPNCEANLANTDQRYCEFCGFELFNSYNTKKEELRVNSKSSRFRRKCC
ncbi:MAG: hypothetical protein ACFFEY_12550 [Candidatus Thorarchaeota archaeon]